MRKLSIILLTLMISSSAILAQKERSFKRGFGEENLFYEEDVRALAEGCSWFYNWGTTPEASIANMCGSENFIEFVPMVWGKNYNLSKIKDWYVAHPNDKFLLGFNEPNLTGNHGGSAVNPTIAAEKWHEIEQFAKDNSLILVAPALNYSPDVVDGVQYSTPDMWMDAWVNAYKEMYGTAPSYDYLALHSYMNDPAAVINYVETFAKKYGKQVWLTEFAAAEGTVSEEYQITSMIEKVNLLERSEYVYRYGWFKGRDTNTGSPYWGLITKPTVDNGVSHGHLSDLGYAYVHMPTYNLEKYYSENEIIASNQFVNCKNLKKIQKSSDKQFSYIPDLLMEGYGLTVTYQIDVPAAGEYKLILRIANENNPKITILDGEDNALVEKYELPKTANAKTFEDVAIDINLPKGKQQISIKKDNFAPFTLSVLQFNTSGTLDIKSTPATQQITDNAWYTLQGTRVAEPTQKGIYIHNGKKVVKK